MEDQNIRKEYGKYPGLGIVHYPVLACCLLAYLLTSLLAGPGPRGESHGPFRLRPSWHLRIPSLTKPDLAEQLGGRRREKKDQRQRQATTGDEKRPREFVASVFLMFPSSPRTEGHDVRSDGGPHGPTPFIRIRYQHMVRTGRGPFLTYHLALIGGE